MAIHSPSTPPAWLKLLREKGVYLGWALLLLCLLGVASFTIHPYLALQNSDGAVFLILANSLYEGNGYILSSLPKPEPYFPFTPLFSVQLATLMALFQPDTLSNFVVVAKSYVWLLWGLTLGLFYALLRPHTRWHFALILTSILAVNGTVHQYLPDVLSDVPYVLVSLLGVMWLSQSPYTGLPGWKGLLTLAVLILTRPIGLSLGVADVLMSAFHKNWKRAAITGLICALSYGSWIGLEHQYRSSHPSHNPAMSQFLEKSGLKLEVLKYFSVQNTENDEAGESGAVDNENSKPWILTCLHRVEQYGRMVSHEIVNGNGQPGFIKLILSLTSLGLILYGAWRILRQRHFLVIAYPLVYFGVLCTYPYVSGRYIIPLAPFILLCGFAGAWHLLEKRPEMASEKKHLALTLMALLVFNQQFDEAARHWLKQSRINGDTLYGPATSDTQKNLFGFYQWTHLPASSQVIAKEKAVYFTRKPEIMYFYTGLKGERFPFFQTPEKLHPWLQAMCQYYQENNVAQQCYLLDDGIYKESRKLLKVYAEAYSNSLTTRYELPNNGVKLWEIKLDKPTNELPAQPAGHSPSH